MKQNTKTMKKYTLQRLLGRAADLLEDYHTTFDKRTGERFDNIMHILESYQ